MPREIQYTAAVEIEGITPLLQNKCVLTDGPTPPGGTDWTDQWKKGTYLDSKGRCCVPYMVLEACLRDGNKNRKLQKQPLTRVIPTGCEVDAFEIPLTVNGKTFGLKEIEKNDWLFTCPVVINGKKISKTRTMIPAGWKLNFNMKVYKPILTPEILEEAIDTAGINAGLMDWRPGGKKPGKFGQFQINSFEVTS